MKKDDSNILELISKVTIHKPKINREQEWYTFILPEGERFKIKMYTQFFYNYYRTTLIVGSMTTEQHINFTASNQIQKQLYTIVKALFESQEDILKNETIANLK